MQRMGLLTAAIVVGWCSVQRGLQWRRGGNWTFGHNHHWRSAPAASAGAQPLTLTVGNSMSFDPTSVTVRAGQPVQLNLQNKGQMPHDFTLADGVGQPVKITAMGGQTASGTFTIEKPGTYSFECSMPGHAAAGMRGTITAQ